jgi:hypothetical protein
MRRISRAVVAAAVSAGVVCATAAGASAGGPTMAQPGTSAKQWGPPCWPYQLRPAIVESEGAAGSTYLTMSYTNVGRFSCTTKGYPRVDFVNAHGRRIGATAARSPGDANPVTIAPGATVTFVVREVHAGIPAGCDTARTYTPAAGLRIMPPGGGPGRLVKLTDNACVNPSVQQLYVGPLTS